MQPKGALNTGNTSDKSDTFIALADNIWTKSSSRLRKTVEGSYAQVSRALVVRTTEWSTSYPFIKNAIFCLAEIWPETGVFT